MAAIDIEKLLAELSAESPCGDDLEYDPAFTEMERAGEGKPEQQIGDSIVAAEDPDWKTVGIKALEVFDRSKDLRAAVYLTRAGLHTDGLVAFADGLQLVLGLLNQYWETIHPCLDPDDANDPTFRVNAITSISSEEVVRSLHLAALVSSRALGQFGLRDIELAKGDVTAAPDTEVTPLATIEGAFLEVDIEELKATASAVASAKESAAAIDAFLMQTVGSQFAPDLTALPAVLNSLEAVLQSQLLRRGEGEEVEGEEGEEGGEGGGGSRLSGQIKTADDVLRAMDKIIEYYSRNEPSSPVPLLMMRAKGLVAKDFMEILRDLTPGGVAEADVIRGSDEY